VLFYIWSFNFSTWILLDLPEKQNITMSVFSNIVTLFQTPFSVETMWNNQTPQNVDLCKVHFGVWPFCDPWEWSMGVLHYLNGVMWLNDRVTPSMDEMAPGQSMAEIIVIWREEKGHLRVKSVYLSLLSVPISSLFCHRTFFHLSFHPL